MSVKQQTNSIVYIIKRTFEDTKITWLCPGVVHMPDTMMMMIVQVEHELSNVFYYNVIPKTTSFI